MDTIYTVSDSWDNPRFANDPEHIDLVNASRRVADTMNLHAIAKAQGWAAFKLADGKSDNMPYPNLKTAARCMKWDFDHYMYLEIAPDGMSDRDAYENMRYHRWLHLQGWRFPYPEFDYDPTMPAFEWDRKKTARHLISGGKS